LKDQTNNNKETLIGIGSNINPVENIKAAIDLLSKDVTIIRVASVWQTPAVGSQGPDYLNTAVLISDPPRLEKLKYQVLSRIEQSLGRVRTQDKNADRTIDLDVLIYLSECLDDDLWEQAHIIIPAAEILPLYSNMITGDSLSSLSEQFKRKVNFILRDDLQLFL
jgi:2-amino-4-hydroxy-6-hydroxymethyldihydropteridine diphosphokinase